MRPRPKRRALGTLFLVLAAVFAGIAVAGLTADVWPVAVAGAALGAWMVTNAYRAWR